MSITLPTLAAALQAIGNAHVFVGDAFTAGGLLPLGAKEGEVRVDIEEATSDLTAEQTGPSVHQRTIMGVNVRITVPIILGDDALYATISPTGEAGGGWSFPQTVQEMAVLIIPDAEVGGGLANADGLTASWVRTAGNGAAGATGAAAGPVHAVWLWRAVPERSGWGFSYENGGKSIVEVVFQGMYYGDNPEGAKIYTIGDPTALASPVAVEL